MDLRLLELDDRAAGVGEIVQLFVQGVGDRQDAVLHRLVVFVLHREGDQLRPDGAELDRLPGHALRHLPHGGVLQLAARDRAGDAGHHARFQIIVQDVAGREGEPALAGRRRLRVLVEAAHVARRVIGPALAADVGIEMRVAVGDDVEAGQFLLVQIDRDGVDILLAEMVVHHGVEEGAAGEVFGVPARPRQRAGDGGRQHDVFGGAVHGRRLPGRDDEPSRGPLARILEDGAARLGTASA